MSSFKKRFSLTLFGCLVLGLFFLFVNSAGAENVSPSQVIKLIVNNKTLTADVPPALINGRTMVPVRVVAEALGILVEFNDSTRTVTASQNNIIVKLIISGNSQYG
ncbi:MAG TPA: hypothetical protein DCK76_10855 [Desulfotomaculum sp.]|nr:MAG: Copper amine oxidase-like domain-containing protein [Desulfotomaculum sp. 46_80]HAG11846.1 hypothetical protein [Desulfotomaculum sp.]HBY03215.1 hypothetical protein [Desulfotomaculum sp.]